MNQATRNRSALFRIDIPGDDRKKAEILRKMQHIREHLKEEFKRPVNNSEISIAALDFGIANHSKNIAETAAPTSFTEARFEESKQNAFLAIIMKTCLYNFDPLKPHFYIVKLGFTGVYIIFFISAQNAQKHILRVLVRVPTIYVLSRNMKNIRISI